MLNEIENNDDRLFINKEGNLFQLPNKFYYDEIILSDYSYGKVPHSDGMHIIAKFDSNIQEYSTTIYCKKPNILYEMLELKDKLSQKLFESIDKKVHCLVIENMLNSKDENNEVGEKELDLIIRWCKRNGYPYKPGIEVPKSRPLFELPNIRNQAFFLLRDFLYDLGEVHDAFSLYEAITAKNTEGNKYKRMGKSVEECKRLFSNKYQEIIFTNKISFDKHIYLTVKSDNLFNAAFYQLALLIENPGVQINKCQGCGVYFSPKKDIREKYCSSIDEDNVPTCTKQKYYRKRKKMQADS